MTKQHYKPHEFSNAINEGVSYEKILAPYFKIRLRKKRNRKKRYVKYLGKKIARHYLAASMIQPIRRAINYGSIGRKIFQVEELPQGTISRREWTCKCGWSAVSTLKAKTLDPTRCRECNGKLKTVIQMGKG